MAGTGGAGVGGAGVGGTAVGGTEVGGTAVGGTEVGGSGVGFGLDPGFPGTGVFVSIVKCIVAVAVAVG